MCCLRLTNVKHVKNRCVRVRATRAVTVQVVQAKQPNVFAIKKIIFTMQHCLHCFYFFDIRTKKKVIQICYL